jgi:transcription antitermination factor NusG
VVTTPGVHMILYRGEQVATISAAEIEAIQKAVRGPFRVEPHPFLPCGSRVRVSRGPLQGLEGILIRKKNSYRLVLSVEMLAQSVCMEIDASDVEAVCRAVAPGVVSGGVRPVPEFARPSRPGSRWGAGTTNCFPAAG